MLVRIGLAVLLAGAIFAAPAASSHAQVESDYGRIQYTGKANVLYNNVSGHAETELQWAAETTDYIESQPLLSFTFFKGTDSSSSTGCTADLIPPPNIGTAFIPPNRYDSWLGVPLPADTYAVFVHFPTQGMTSTDPSCAGGPKYAFDPNYNFHTSADKQQEFTNAYQAPMLYPIDGSKDETDYNFDILPDDKNGLEMHIHSVVRLTLMDPPAAN